MRDARIGLAQIAPRLGDVAANLETHRDAAATARREGCGLVVFPELSLTGYLLRDLVSEVAIGPGHPTLLELERVSSEIDVVAGFVWEDEGHRYFNAAGYFAAGHMIHLHRKVYLPTYGLFQEGRDFSPGDRVRGFDSPIGPAGMLICEDLWHQTTAWLLAHQGAELLLGLSAGPTRGARDDGEVTSVAVWRQLNQVTAKFLTSFVVWVNRVGCEDGLTYGGGSMVVDPFGRIVGGLAALDEGLLPVDLDADLLRRARVAYPLLRDTKLDLVARELERVRAERYGTLDDEPKAETPDPAPVRSRNRT